MEIYILFSGFFFFALEVVIISVWFFSLAWHFPGGQEKKKLKLGKCHFVFLFFLFCCGRN